MPERETDGGTLWHGFVSDVTERHEAEVALREQAALLELSSDAVFVRAADTDVLTSRMVAVLITTTARTHTRALPVGYRTRR